MLIVFWASWFLSSRFAISEVLAEGSGILVLIAGAILIYRTFQEKYLFLWIIGWIFYLTYREWEFVAESALDPRVWLLLSHSAFVCATALLVIAVLLYTNSKAFLLPVSVAAVGTLILVAVRIYGFPNSFLMMLAVHLGYRLMSLTGAVQLARFNRGRLTQGPWLMVLTLLLLHMDDRHTTTHPFHDLDAIIELLLGLSMLIIVLDDSKARTDRLEVLNSIGNTIAEAQDSSTMIRSSLAELKVLCRARAAWVRMKQGERMVLLEQIGLPSDYVQQRRELDASTSYGARLMVERQPVKMTVAGLDEKTRLSLESCKFHHLLMIPMAGKSSVIGVLLLGIAYERSYTADELKFLVTTTNQLALAMENLRMFEQIVHSQRQWVATFDSIADLVLVHDANGSILRVNRALLSKLRVPNAQDVVGRRVADVLPNAVGGCPYCLRSSKYSTTDADADPCFGGYSMVSTSNYSVEGASGAGIVHVIRDTTQLLTAEERYRLLFEEVREGVFISTASGQLLSCNDAFVRLLGYQSRAQVLSLNVAKELYEDLQDRERFMREIEQHGFVRNYEFALRRKDGSRATVLENSFATRRPDGTIDRIQGFVVDITEKKRVEEEIRRYNRELNALNRMSVIANQSFDLDEILNVTLRQCVELFGAETGAILLLKPGTNVLRRRASWGHSVGAEFFHDLELPQEFLSLVQASHTELVTPQHLPQLPPVVHQFVEREQLRSWRWIILWSHEKPFGIVGVSSRTEREFSQTDENLLIAIGRQLATTIEKVRLYEETSRAYEDLRRTQEQLLQSEKMSAVGQLISGVAHELNNPLTAILGYSQLLESEPLPERSLDFVSKLYKQAQRTHRVVQNLLSFARQRKPAKQTVDLRRVIEETLALRDYDLKLNNIEVERTFGNDLPTVVADPHQLEQVFLNIVNNAVDAILELKKSGKLQVRTYAEGDYVCAEFHDSGPGIKEPKKIFDPFFTTKKIGKGTGLGLSICYGITKEHGGEILALNHPAGGAVFRVLLPIAASKEEGPRDRRSKPRDHGVQGRVLLVDDEEALLEFEREVLTGAGATVITATTGDAAIERLRRETFDVILLDGKMPGKWSVSEIHSWLKEHRPEMAGRIVLAVSDSSEESSRRFLESNSIPCLLKPFEVADLLSIVRRVAFESANRAGA
ncbi:MAG TPA: PAS domain S-box protein [Terriglobales bacterium]|nr:PAS domain S-box protein [Terriglobales bacterium]